MSQRRVSRRAPRQLSSTRRPADDDARAIDGRRRVVVERVRPEIDGGRFPIKRTVGEAVHVTAWVHADGHDVIVAVLRYRTVRAGGTRAEWLEQPMQPLGNDEWTASFDIERQCSHEYTVQAWVDRFMSWRKALVAKVEAGQDVSSELLEGAALLRSTAGRARGANAAKDARWLDAQADLIGGAAGAAERARAAQDDRLAGLSRRFPDLSQAATYDRVLTVSVDRERARFGAWYEMFPRSWGPDPTRSATFREAETHLQRVAGMGFDIVYLPPIHPIGTSFRKGRGNSLTAEAGDPGSPWAIGSEAGGHKAVDPALGTLADFEHFVAEARRLGLEVALDLAYQCSPDHPYVREHPEWFRHRPDGTIKYAENPPKKYQDIYPFDFESEAWPALWEELKSVVRFWVAHDVSIFRVDNPHTKPYPFWEWLIREIRTEHPAVIFLAEAFTRPKVMYYLAKLGFTQSYTYFTWRNTREELTEYLTELTGTEAAEFFRPNLFANTPDILHAFLQQGGPRAFEIRLILAAMLGATYGIYSGFELVENRAVPGSEEYLDSEKYQYRRWDWDRPGHIKDLVTAVNRIRRGNPALQFNETLMFCETDNPDLIAFCKISPDGMNAILAVVNLDYEHVQHGWLRAPLDRLGLPQRHDYEVMDLLDGARYPWRGEWNYVKLDPAVSVAHVFELPVAPPDIVARTSGALGQFLSQQRWFAGKARTIANARVVDWAAPASREGGLMPAIAEVQYTDGGTERYFIPVVAPPDVGPSTTSGDGTIEPTADRPAVVDAFADDEACRALLGAMLRGLPMAMRDGTARATAQEPTTDVHRWRIVRGATEQSNSCVRFGNRYMLKLLRRLESGPNPELEISRFLAGRGFAGIPPLAASLEYEKPGEEPVALALVQTFVANEGTGWDRALADAREFITRAPAPVVDAIGFLEPAAALGRRTGELHLALATDDRDPAFMPEPFTAVDAAGLAENMRLGARRVLTLLAERLETLPEAVRHHARAVIAARAQLSDRIDAVATAPTGSLRTRVHGDYHLGQVLSVGRDFVIVDFEGEPARPLAERRAKHSPVKDVAGMLRSFSYAAEAALLTASESRPHPGAGLELRARLWEAGAASAFLKEYRRTAAQGALAPADDRSFGRLLNAFILDKALYEVGYELASRPHWVGVPLLGILRILSAPDGEVGAR